MTDNPTNAAGGDLPGAPQPSIDPLPAISYSEAESRKAELFANEEWRNAFFSGSVEAKREWDQIVRGLAAPPPAPANEREAIVEHLRQHADITEAVADEIRSDRASTPWEHQRALQRRDQLFRDEAWVERYNRGDGRAQTEVALINLILSRRIRDNPNEP